jgi:RNA polymerase sigma-70 factor (ECF subfamily)
MKVDEDKIREACTRNPEEGFRMLVDQFQQPMYWHIRRMVVSHEDAEDVLQETFIRIFRYIGDFRSESSLSTWIYRIVTNECIRFLNKKKEEILSSEEVQEDLLNKLMASEYVDYENEMEVKFQQAVLRLPEKQRVVFNLRYYDELSYEEISKITDSKVETLKANYHFAKEKIKEYMTNN